MGLCRRGRFWRRFLKFWRNGRPTVVMFARHFTGAANHHQHLPVGTCRISSAAELPSSMSQLLLLLTLSAVGLPPLESFLLSPPTASPADWLHQRRRPSNSNAIAPSAVYGSSSCNRDEVCERLSAVGTA